MTHFVDEFSSCVVYNYPFVQRSYCIYHSVNSLPQYEFVHVFFGWYLIWMLFHNNCKHIFSLENVISHVSSKHLCPWILTHINDKERVSGHYGLSCAFVSSSYICKQNYIQYTCTYFQQSNEHIFCVFAYSFWLHTFLISRANFWHVRYTYRSLEKLYYHISHAIE